MAEIKPGDSAYQIAEHPQYDPIIRKLKTTDPAHAETVFNPLFQQIIENLHAVKVSDDGKASRAVVSNVSLSVNGWSGAASPYIQEVSITGMTETGLVFIKPEEEDENTKEVGRCRIRATGQAENKLTFTAESKPTKKTDFIIVNCGN